MTTKHPVDVGASTIGTNAQARQLAPPFLRQTWYVAAWGAEMNGALLGRTLLGEPVLLYRAADGTPVALSDRCPHRFAPLHLGRLVDDRIECAYHGLRFDRNGRCVLNPHGDGRVPAAAKVRAYPVVERHGLIWFWPGDAERADPSLIPDFSQITAADWRTLTGQCRIAANYQLVADNLLDLSHTQFLHAEFQAAEGFLKVKHEVQETGGTVVSRRWMPDIELPMSFARHGPELGERVDHWVRARWDAPALVRLDVGICPVGGREEAGMRRNGSHFLTPEHESSTHYFFANSRNYKLSDTTIDHAIAEWQRIGFGEQDKPMIESVQSYMRSTDLIAEKPVLLLPDAAAMRARRVLAERIRQESAAVQASEAGVHSQ